MCVSSRAAYKRAYFMYIRSQVMNLYCRERALLFQRAVKKTSDGEDNGASTSIMMVVAGGERGDTYAF